MRKSKPLEKEIQNEILDYLRIKGIFCWRSNSVGVFDPRKGVFRRPTGRNAVRGVSDILGILHTGTLLAIEVKRPGGRVSPEQMSFIGAIAKHGGTAFVAYSLKDVQEKLGI